jgi:Fic family protein
LYLTWQERAEELKQSSALRDFNERLQREWSIETGIIENLYSIDRGTTILLIEHGIRASLMPFGSTDKPAEHVASVLQDHKEVLEGLFDFVSQRRQLSTSYIKQLHQALTRHQSTVEAVDGLGRYVEVPLERGVWKVRPNNPKRPDGEIHEYCPPEQVDSEMDRLIDMHRQHMLDRVGTEVEAAWLHHRFAQIHPFQDGNGRIARTLASLVFIRAGWFPLVVHRDSREAYIGALEQADKGDLKPLVDLFSRIQKRAFNNALSLSENVFLEHDPLKQIISAATDQLRERTRSRKRRPFDLSNRLEEYTENRLSSVASEINSIVRSGVKDLDQFFAVAERNREDNAFWFYNQIVAVARELGYYADTRTYRAWVRLKIKEERQTELVISFHASGAGFTGLMAVSAFVEYRDVNEDGEHTIDGPHRVSDDVFQFSHRDKEVTLDDRFGLWLDQVLIVGLDQWRRQL